MGAENLKYSPYMIVKITGSEEKLEVKHVATIQRNRPKVK